MQNKIGYSEFVAICRVHDPKNFGGFHVKTEGLYVNVPDEDVPLTPMERAVLSWHPTGIHKNPALPLPCTLEELRSFVADAGLLGCIDEDAVAAMLQEAGDTAEAQTAAEKKVVNRGITKQQVINAFEGLYFDRVRWSKYLADPPEWLKICRVAPGRQGDKSTPATWNPVLIAVALTDKEVPTKKIDAVFFHLKDWADEWREASVSFRD